MPCSLPPRTRGVRAQGTAGKPQPGFLFGAPHTLPARRAGGAAPGGGTSPPPEEAQLAATVNGAGANAPPAATLNHVEPREKCGGTTLLLRCPNPTAMSSAPCAPVASMESSTSEYCTRKAAVSVASVVSPAWAAPRRSLFPSQTLTKVGCAAIMACVWVRPPSISNVRAFEFVPGVGKFEMPSITSAPGTATLVKKGGMFGLRNAHVMLVPPATRA